jgi:hypothetical protein
VTADVGAAADELYALPAQEFTAARDRRAADARGAGDRDLAAAIKKLRRPTVTAWFANQLVRQHPDQVAELLATGVALRRAQADLDVEELRHQTQAGQQLVTDLARQARQLAADTGQSLSDDNVRELEETLHAGLVDPDAGAAIRAGRLTTSLRYSGFGLADTGDAAAPPAPAPASVPAPAAPAPVSAAPAPVPAAPAIKATPRRRDDPEVEAAARQARQDAEAELAAARRQAGEQARRAEQARKHQEVLRQRIRRLDDELEQLRTEESEAGDAVVTAARARRAAEGRVARAEERLEELQ